MKYGVKWSEEETILAFELYSRIPFSKIAKSHPDIIELARILDRTPSSVGLKLANLAACDPEIRARKLHGLANNSKLDQQVFDAFAGNSEELAYRALIIRAQLTGESLDEALLFLDLKDIPEGIDRLHEVKQRVGQHYFREAVLTAYGRKCCITGVSTPELLIASHIKPWSVSSPSAERTNPCNGLCLNALHDRAFDRGLITLDEDYRILNSAKLKECEMDEQTKKWFEFYNHQTITLPERFLPSKEFIEYHNNYIFLY